MILAASDARISRIDARTAASDPNRRPTPSPICDRLLSLRKVPEHSAVSGRASKDSLRQIPSTSSRHNLKPRKVEEGSEDNMFCKPSRSQ